MEPFTEREAKALSSVIMHHLKSILFIFFDLFSDSHSILLNLNVNRFLGHFRKWGLCARTCIGLQRGFLTESELQGDATRAARKFARDPRAAAITIEAPSQDAFDASDVLFTICPNDGRSTHTLRVSTPYHCGLVLEDVAATRS